MELDFRHICTMVHDTSLFQFLNHLAGVGRVATNHLYYMILHAGSGRMADVDSHPLGTAQVKMGYDVKYLHSSVCLFDLRKTKARHSSMVLA